jgi:hypothetical protein
VGRTLKGMRALALILTLAACATSLAVASDWTRYGRAGASLQLPSTWRDLSRKSELLRTTDNLARSHPRLRAYLQALSRLNGPLLKVVAVDLAPASLRYGFLSTVSLKFEPALPSRASWFDAVESQVEADAAVAKPVWHRRLRLPAGQALELRYRWTLSVPGANYRVAATQFAVLLPSSAYMLVYWTTPEQAASYRPIFERSARTLHVVG